MRGVIARLAVFLGSRDGTGPAWADEAYTIGTGLAERGVELVYGGGGSGLMGRISQGVLDAGGRVYGVIPRFMVDREWARLHQPGVELHVVETMHERKAMMARRAQAFLALPGGLGTLEELFEVWTWQTLSLHAKPVGLFNAGGFWDPLLHTLHRLAEAGFMDTATVEALVVGDDLDDVLGRLDEAAAH